MPDGELWIASDGAVELRPHSADSYLRHVLDVDYDPDARCPEYDRAVADIFCRDKATVRLWHEVCGYTVQPQRTIALVLICEGLGGNGKTR